MKNAKILILLSLLSFSAISADRTNINVPKTDFSFTEIGYSGFDYKPNILTWQQANSYCDLVATQLSGENVYQRCVNSFIPTLEETSVAVNDCAATPVNWGGMCRAVIDAGINGQQTQVRHQRLGDNDDGQAVYNCLNGSWVYQNGFCADLPKNCDQGATVEWPVTFPNWAKSGGEREKNNCSGVLETSIKTPDVVLIKSNDTNFDLARTSSKRVCIDGNLLPLSSDQNCVYVPKSCPERNFMGNTCRFKLPETQHTYNLSNPDAPAIPVSVSYDGPLYHGDYSAECMDGSWLKPTVSCFTNPFCGNVQNTCQTGNPIHGAANPSTTKSCPSGYVLESDNQCYRYTNSVKGCISEITLKIGSISYKYFDVRYSASGTCVYEKRMIENNSSTIESVYYLYPDAIIDNFCNVGVYNSNLNKCVQVKGVTTTNTNYYAWKCQNGRKSVNCNYTTAPISNTNPDPVQPVTPIPPPIIIHDNPPICGNSLFTCISGTVINLFEVVIPNYWQCASNQAQMKVDCSVNPEPAPVCNNSVLNSCSSGTFADIADSSTHNLWTCKNSTQTANCSKTKPVEPPPVSNQCVYNTGGYQYVTYDTLTTTFAFLDGSPVVIGGVQKPSVTDAPSVSITKNGKTYKVGALKKTESMDWAGIMSYFEVCISDGGTTPPPPPPPPVTTNVWQVDCLYFPTRVPPLNVNCSANAATYFDDILGQFLGFRDSNNNLNGKNCSTLGEKTTTTEMWYRDGYYSTNQNGSARWVCVKK